MTAFGISFNFKQSVNKRKVPGDWSQAQSRYSKCFPEPMYNKISFTNWPHENFAYFISWQYMWLNWKQAHSNISHSIGGKFNADFELWHQSKLIPTHRINDSAKLYGSLWFWLNNNEWWKAHVCNHLNSECLLKAAFFFVRLITIKYRKF